MTKYKKLTSNYEAVMQRVLPGTFLRNDQPDEALLTIQKDIARQGLFDFRKNLDRYQSLWKDYKKPEFYSQGNMDGATIAETMFQLFIMNSLKNMDYMRGDNKGDLRFAYIDAAGIPCGFTLVYSKLDPTLWSAVLIRNTNEEPINRTVTVIAREDMFANPTPAPAALTESNEDILDVPNIPAPAPAHTVSVLTELLDNVNCDEVKTCLKSVFLDNGQINAQNAELIGQQIGTISFNKERELLAILRSHLLSQEVSDDVCLWLMLLIRQHRGEARRFNSLDTTGLQMLRNAPANSPLLEDYKHLHATDGMLAALRQSIASESAFPKNLTQTSLVNTDKLTQDLDALSRRKNIIMAFWIIAICGAIAGGFFFPPILIAIGLACVSVPILFELKHTDKHIQQLTADKNTAEAARTQLSGSLLTQENNDRIFYKQIEDLCAVVGRSQAKPQATPTTTQHEVMQDLEENDESDNDLHHSDTPFSAGPR